MMHHVSVGTSDLRTSRAFYDPVMAHLGFRLLDGTGGAADYGIGDALFSVETPVDGAPATAGNGSHIAFVTRDRIMMDQFHQLALANGGTDAGNPGLRPAYNADHCSAFVRCASNMIGVIDTTVGLLSASRPFLPSWSDWEVSARPGR